MRAVCLFDIDGTLLTTGGAGQLAMERALAAVFGLAAINSEILSAGRTDKAITSDLFREHRLDVGPAEWARFQSEYLRRLPQTMQELGGRILPGIPSLLLQLSAHPEVEIGLLTGNFRAGAALKLRHFAIEHHFHFGGFGDDHHDRDDVARAALNDARRHLCRDVDPRRVWVLGDTPSDVRCARAIGAQAVAVATGIFDYPALQATRPDLLLSDFTDAGPFLDRLLN